MQKGYFIYQPYKITDGGNGIMPFPNALDDLAITVDVINTDEILKELDNVNVNLSTLFGDYDNIAKYLKGRQE